MVVGTLRITLHVPESGSLKEKRMVVRSLVSRVRQRFDVAIAEVGDQDTWQSVVVGIACVSGDSRHADEICQKVLRYVEEEAEAEVTRSEFELVHL